MKELALLFGVFLILPSINAVLIEGNNTIGNETLILNETGNVTLECKWVEGELLCNIPSFVSYVDIGEVVEAPEPEINLTFSKSDIDRWFTGENATGDAIQDIRAELTSYRDYMRRMNENFEAYINTTNEQLDLFNETVYTVIYVTNESTMKAMHEAEESRGQGIWQGVGTVIGVISTIGGSAVVYWIKWGRWNF